MSLAYSHMTQAEADRAVTLLYLQIAFQLHHLDAKFHASKTPSHHGVEHQGLEELIKRMEILWPHAKGGADNISKTVTELSKALDVLRLAVTSYCMLAHTQLIYLEDKSKPSDTEEALLGTANMIRSSLVYTSSMLASFTNIFSYPIQRATKLLDASVEEE